MRPTRLTNILYRKSSCLLLTLLAFSLYVLCPNLATALDLSGNNFNDKQTTTSNSNDPIPTEEELATISKFTDAQLSAWKLVDKAILSGDAEKALAIADDNILDFGEHPFWDLRKALILEELDNLEEAISLLNRCTPFYRNKTPISLITARLYAENKDMISARKILDDILSEQPNNKYARLLSGLVFAADGHFEEAEANFSGWTFTEYTWLTRQIFKNKFYTKLLYNGTASTGDIDNWKNAFFGPVWPKASSLLEIQACIYQKKWSEALKKINELEPAPIFRDTQEYVSILVAISDNQQFTYLQHISQETFEKLSPLQMAYIGSILLEQEKGLYAMAWFSRCLKQWPNNPELLFGKAVALAAGGFNEQAVKTALAVQETEPELFCLWILGDEEPLSILRQALGENNMCPKPPRDPKDASMLNNITWLLKQKRLIEANVALQHIPENERDAQWFFLKYQTALQAGNSKDAISILDTACQKQPDNQFLIYSLLIEAAKQQDHLKLSQVSQMIDNLTKPDNRIRFFAQVATEQPPETCDSWPYLLQYLSWVYGQSRGEKMATANHFTSLLPHFFSQQEISNSANLLINTGYLDPSQIGWNTM